MILSRISASLILLSVISVLAFSGCTSERSDQDPESKPEKDLSIAITPQTISAGKEIYMRTCSLCHGQAGKGDGPAAVAFNPKPRDHTDGKYMDKLSNDHIFKTIKFGGAQFDKPTMPAQPALSDEEIMRVVAYVRSLSATFRR